MLIKLMNYAIIQLSGKQLWIQVGKFYDVNKLNIAPGQTLFLNKVLLLRLGNLIHFGKPCLSRVKIKAKVLRHFKSDKVTVFKMKSKKNTKSTHGSRQILTRILIQQIKY